MSDRVYISVEQAAEQVGVCAMTIRRLVWGGQIPAVKLGRLVRIPADWLDTLKAAQELRRLGGVPQFAIRDIAEGQGNAR